MASLRHARSGVQLPRYERGALRPGLVHLGVGAFHRCHQAEYNEDAIEAGAENRFITGINLHPPRLGETLGEQDGLFSRALREAGEVRTRVIGCLRRGLDAPSDRHAAILAVAAADVVTMTVTEKGYCHVPATGQLDEMHPGIEADLADPVGCRTLPAFLAAALDARRGARGGGVTLVSCDNIPSNGAILRAVTTAFAAARDPGLAIWIGDNVKFPSTMVDRIVPATTEADRAAAAEALGLEDRACVGGEMFRQFVLEADFAGRRPGWEAAGAEFVGDVKPYELVKMRVLNAAQTTVSLIGMLIGLTYSHEAMAHPMLRRFAERFLAEGAPTLPRHGGIDLSSYQATTLRRIANAAIRHRCDQIAADSSQKIIQRLLDPVRENLAAGREVRCLAAAVAAFVAVRARATPTFGGRWIIDDPIATAAEAAAARSGGDPDTFTRQMFAITAIFGDLREQTAFVASVRRHVHGWLAEPAIHLERALAIGDGDGSTQN